MWIFAGTLAYVLFILICIVSYAIEYLTLNVHVESFSQLLYTMQVSMGGAENTIFQILSGFFGSYWLLLAAGTAVFVLYILLCRRIRAEQEFPEHIRKVISLHSCKPLIRTAAVLCSVCMTLALINQVHIGWNVLGVDEYLQQRSMYSSLYEDYYVKPEEASITFPQKKKNLIYIYCESMEATFSDAAHGGASEMNLIPNLTRLALENESFQEKGSGILGGGRVTNSTSWTIAGIVAQTSGTPLCQGNGEFTREFDGDSEFMPALSTLGEILEKEGYHNMFMCGSDAAYGGRANYFTQHGNYEIFDLFTARETGKIPENYKEWWGFEDEKLFDYAREAILDLAEQDEPFNFTMLTADTHFKNGYLCEDCPERYDEQYENVIACSDRRIAQFVDWLQAQPFYEDTTIIISGDHLSMDGLITEMTGADYARKNYFCIINGPERESSEARSYTTLDLFPTTLEALGAEIEGGRLGLGTGLYNGRATLSEELGVDEFNQQIAYNSHYYNREILQGDESSD